MIKRHWRKLLAASLIVVGNLFCLPVADAEFKTYTAMGVDYGNELESQDIVKLRARDKAIKNAVKQAGVYLKTYSRSVNNELTEDEITAITSNTYEIVGEVRYNQVAKQVTDQIILVMWEATVDVKVDDGEIRNWRKRDLNERSKLITQTRETNEAASENERNVEDLRKRASTITDEAGRAKLKSEFEQVDNEFLSNQKIEEGTRLAYNQKFDDAIKLYTEAIELKPDNATAYNWRGNIRNVRASEKELVDKNVAEGKKLREQALDDLNRAIQLKPDYSEAYGNRGFVYYMAKNYPNAIKDFNRAIELNPRHVQNYVYRALYWKQIAKDNAHALADYNKALELDPKNAHVYMNRANFYRLDMENYSLAIEDLTKAIQFETQEFMIGYHYYDRGECYQKLKMYDKAIADFTQAIPLMGRDENFKGLVPWAYKARSECYKALGDTAKAKADFDKAKILGYDL
ncbi:MAG: tetratricopeptide repeat protein [Quinella sp. 1Q5]|nr:tetratricopeptide repeat protein [Quinella sp. 1Q5]